MDQLNLMDTKMREAAEDLAANDTERLLTNARFLQERFATSTLEPSARPWRAARFRTVRTSFEPSRRHYRQ